MRILKITVLAAAILPAAACATIAETVSTPQLSPIVYPVALAPQEQQMISPGQIPQSASANSLWRSGARAFFFDQRASKVGDILTVSVEIDDKAATTNSSSSSRSSGASLGVPNFLGFETSIGKIFPQAYDPSNLVNTESNNTNAGSGAIIRQEKINLTIAATVTGVLANGNLMIQGSQEVRTNNEVRQLIISGFIRPEDITAQNTISHTQIADARISYGGRGDQSRVQKTPAGQAIIERFSPF